MCGRPQARDVSVLFMHASLPRPTGTRLDHSGKLCLDPYIFLSTLILYGRQSRLTGTCSAGSGLNVKQIQVYPSSSGITLLVTS